MEVEATADNACDRQALMAIHVKSQGDGARSLQKALVQRKRERNECLCCLGIACKRCARRIRRVEGNLTTYESAVSLSERERRQQAV